MSPLLWTCIFVDRWPSHAIYTSKSAHIWTVSTVYLCHEMNPKQSACIALRDDFRFCFRHKKIKSTSDTDLVDIVWAFQGLLLVYLDERCWHLLKHLACMDLIWFVFFFQSCACSDAQLKSRGRIKRREEDSLQVPLLKHKKRGGSKAPAVILGEQSSML